jgi:hypothetical protein
VSPESDAFDRLSCALAEVPLNVALREVLRIAINREECHVVRYENADAIVCVLTRLSPRRYKALDRQTRAALAEIAARVSDGLPPEPPEAKP